APSICAQCIKIPLPADLPAHCQQVATLQELGVFSECGIHRGLLGGKAPQFEYLLQQRVIQLNVRFHVARVYMQGTARGTWFYVSYVHWLRSLGPLRARCPPLPSARAASRTRRSADAVDPLHRDTVSDEVGVCIRASPCCAASKSRSESPDILPGGSAGLHSGAVTVRWTGALPSRRVVCARRPWRHSGWAGTFTPRLPLGPP